ncbi:MAG: hypothetical protein NWQ56_01180 [Burkholderiaceae bacterium]|jgi:hypothetical protein|nr:hypothetical protein [Burkholderiaceae bacterium]MDP4968649.1 hypothetical protein [Burkholderiaceae bacterium]
MKKLPIQTEPALWGAAAGAIIAIVIGFGFANWHTAGQAKSMSQEQSALATVAALTPVCVEMFKRDSQYEANLVELKKIDEWSRYNFIEKGGWGKMPDANKLDSEVASQCAATLVKT